MHLHQVWLDVLTMELLPNWTGLHAMDVRLCDILDVVHPRNSLEVVLLLWHAEVLGNWIKCLFVVNLEVVTGSGFQWQSVWSVLSSRVAEATDCLGSCRSESSLPDVFCIVMQSRSQFCDIGGPFSHGSRLNCGCLEKKFFFCGLGFIPGSVGGNGVRGCCQFWWLRIRWQAKGLCLGIIAFHSKFLDLLSEHQTLHIAGHAPMAPGSAFCAGGEVGIQVSVPVEMACAIGLAVLIITVGTVVSLMLHLVFIHTVDVFLVWVYSDLHNSETCVPLEDCWIAWCERCALRMSCFGGLCYLL